MHLAYWAGRHPRALSGNVSRFFRLGQVKNPGPGLETNDEGIVQIVTSIP